MPLLQAYQLVRHVPALWYEGTHKAHSVRPSDRVLACRGCLIFNVGFETYWLPGIQYIPNVDRGEGLNLCARRSSHESNQTLIVGSLNESCVNSNHISIKRNSTVVCIDKFTFPF
jgi:hypothetical protein